MRVRCFPDFYQYGGGVSFGVFVGAVERGRSCKASRLFFLRGITLLVLFLIMRHESDYLAEEQSV